MVAAVRVALGRTLVQRASPDAGELPVITLDPQLEQILKEAVTGGDDAGIEPGLAEQVQNRLAETAQQQEIVPVNRPCCWYRRPCGPWLSRFLRFAVPNLKVLAYNEVPDSKRVKLIAAVGA